MFILAHPITLLIVSCNRIIPILPFIRVKSTNKKLPTEGVTLNKGPSYKIRNLILKTVEYNVTER